MSESQPLVEIRQSIEDETLRYIRETGPIDEDLAYHAQRIADIAAREIREVMNKYQMVFYQP